MYLDTLLDHPAFVMACPLLLPKHLRLPSPDLEVKACVVKYRTDHPDYEGGWWLEVYVNDELVNDCNLYPDVHPDWPLIYAQEEAHKLLDDAEWIEDGHL